MILTVPFPTGSAWIQEVTLSGRVYRINGAWNEVGNFWQICLMTRDEVPIIDGLKLVGGIDLIGRFADDRLPPGELYIIGEEPTRKSFENNQSELLYVI